MANQDCEREWAGLEEVYAVPTIAGVLAHRGRDRAGELERAGDATGSFTGSS